MTGIAFERFIKLLAIVLISAGLIILLLVTLKDNLLFYLTPSDLHTPRYQEAVRLKKKIRLGGLVKKKSLTKKGNKYIFSIEDSNRHSLRVEYVGVLPAMFAENKGVIAEGVITNGVCQATHLLAKHDEYYQVKR